MRRVVRHGKAFDAVSALLCVCTKRTYEASPRSCSKALPIFLKKVLMDRRCPLKKRGSLLTARRCCPNYMKDIKSGHLRRKSRPGSTTPLPRQRQRRRQSPHSNADANRVASRAACFKRFLVERLVPLLQQAGLVTAMHRRNPPNDECFRRAAVVAGAGRQSAG